MIVKTLSRQDIIIICGDFNAKIGKKNMTAETGLYGWGVMNNAGQWLADFCTENSLAVMNTVFQQPLQHLYTWTLPDGKHWNQINYVLIPERWKTCIHAVKTLSGADCGSGHQLLCMKTRLKLKTVWKMPYQIRFDTQKIPVNYIIKVENRFSAIAYNLTHANINEMWKAVCDVIMECGKKHMPRLKKWYDELLSENM